MNLFDALENYGIKYKKSGTPDEIWLCCPFCLDEGYTQDTRYRLGVNVRTEAAHCFNCEWRSRKSFRYLQAALELGRFDRVTEESEDRGRVSNPPSLPEDFEVVRREVVGDYWSRFVYRYCRARGLTDTQLLAHNIGYSLVGRFAYRVIVPVYSSRRNLIGLVARDFTGKREPKYLNSFGEKGIYNVREDKAETGILVEGCFDALAIERAVANDSFGDALAVLGHSLSDSQIEMLQGYRRFILWPDPDKAGIEGFTKMGHQLKEISSDVRIVMPRAGDKDPDEMPLEAVRQRLNLARPFSQAAEYKLKLKLAFKE